MHHFKLQFNDTTRRISFAELPNWLDLAGKIELVCNIPFSRICVSYVDIDGDEITLNSQEELDDYYAVTHKGGTIRFAVHDIGALRHDQVKDKSLPETPRDSARNTFGAQPLDGADDDDDEEWQRLPRMFMTELSGVRLEQPPHAFIEVVDSDVNSVTKPGDQTFDDSMSTTSDDLFDSATHEKGKSRQTQVETVTDDEDKGSLSSTGSLIANGAPTKFPVHVYDRSTELDDIDAMPARRSSPFFSASAQQPSSAPSTVRGVPAESTPKLHTQALEDSRTALEPIPDPPLPNIDSPVIDTPSILNDVASLLNSIKSHPELVDGLRKITSNAANGNYWAAHRDAISRDASEISRATQDPARAAYQEAEAGKRVAEALGGIFKSFVAPQQLTAGPESMADALKIWADEQQQNNAFQDASPAAVDRDLRAEVEAAKEAYKQAKEKYREDRETRKKQKDEKQRLIKLIAGIPPSALPTVAPAAPVVNNVHLAATSRKPEVHLVSNARGKYPELEMFSVPLKNTAQSAQPAPTVRQPVADQTGEALFLRSVHRILKRLSDMGFAESAHPTLPNRVKSMLPPNGTTKHAEDEIVTTLLESMLEESAAAAALPKQPIAGSSAVRR